MNYPFAVICCMRDTWAYSRADASGYHPRGRGAIMAIPRIFEYGNQRPQRIEREDEEAPQTPKIVYFEGLDAAATAENYAAEQARNNPQYSFLVVKSVSMYAAQSAAASKSVFTPEGLLPA